jgi:hypothetical protein
LSVVMLSVIMLSVIMLSVVMLSVIMLGVVAPGFGLIYSLRVFVAPRHSVKRHLA